MDALRDLVRHVLNVSIEEIAEDELAAFFYALADQDQNGEGRSGGGAWSFYKILGLLESDHQRQQEQEIDDYVRFHKPAHHLRLERLRGRLLVEEAPTSPTPERLLES